MSRMFIMYERQLKVFFFLKKKKGIHMLLVLSQKEKKENIERQTYSQTRL